MKKPTLPRPPNSRSARLTALRGASGLDQVDMAAALGGTQSTWSRIESGTREPTVKQLVALAELYNTTLDYIELGRGPGATPPQAGEFVNDPDELVWLDFWRRVHPDDKPALFRILGFAKREGKVG